MGKILRKFSEQNLGICTDGCVHKVGANCKCQLGKCFSLTLTLRFSFFYSVPSNEALCNQLVAYRPLSWR